MQFYIVGTQRNKQTEVITGYYLVNMDENLSNFIIVDKNTLINKMKAGVRIENAVLDRNKVKGEYYEITKLNSFDENGKLLKYNGILVLKATENEWICVTLTAFGVRSTILNKEQINVALRSKKDYSKVINIDNSGVLRCPGVEYRVIDDISQDPYINKVNALIENEKSIVHISHFEEYMKAHGWSYTLEKGADGLPVLSDIDSRCTCVHIPQGIKLVKNLFASKPVNKVNKIIVGDSVEFIGALYGDRNVAMSSNPSIDVHIGLLTFEKCDVKKIIHGASNSENSILSPFNYLQIDELRMSNTKKTVISNMFSYCNIGKLLLSTESNIYYNSFNQSNIAEVIGERLKLVTDANYSFNNCQGISDLTIDINSEVNGILESFNNSAIKYIDTSEATNLHKLEKSFAGSLVTEIDLTACQYLRRMGNKVFENSPNLTVVKRNGFKLIEFAPFALNGCPIKQIEIATSLSIIGPMVGNDNTKFVVSEGIDAITSSYIRNEYLISDRICFNKPKKLHGGALKYTHIELGPFDKVPNIFSKIGRLGVEALALANYKNFDSKHLPLISSIPARCFRSSDVETIILNNNIDKVDETAFEECVNLKNLVINGNVQGITSKAITKIKQESILTIYYVVGTPCEKVIKRKSKGVIIVPVQSVDEAIAKIYPVGDTTDSTASKIKMMLSTGKYSKLTEEKYIANAKFYLRMLRTLVDNETVDSAELYTSKFSDREIYIEQLNKTVAGLDDRYNTIPNSANLVSGHTRIFTGMSNLFTTLHTNQADEFNSIAIDKINSGICNIKNVLYADKNDKILICKTSYNKIRMDLLLIIVNNQIRFISTCDYKSRTDMYGDGFRTFMQLLIKSYTANDINIDAVASFGNWLIRGDRISRKIPETRINGLPFPDIGLINGDKLINIISESMFVVAVAKTKSNKSMDTCLVYDAISQKFIIALKNNAYGQSEYSSYTVDDVFDLNDINKMPQVFHDIFNEIINGTSKEALIYLGADDNYKNTIYSNLDNYDVHGNEELIPLAKKLYNSGIDSIEKCTTDIFKKILGSQFYRKTTAKTDNIDIDQGKYQVISSLQLNDKILGEFSCTKLFGTLGRYTTCGFPNTYFIGKIEKDTNGIVVDNIYMSIVPLSTVISILYKIGENISNGVSAINKITISPHSKGQLVMLNKRNYYSVDACYGIGIDTANGDIFILIEDLNTNKYYTVLRVKSMTEAIELVDKYFFSLVGVQYHYNDFVKSILDEKAPNADSDYTIEVARAYIMSGYTEKLGCVNSLKPIINVLNKSKKQPK